MSDELEDILPPEEIPQTVIDQQLIVITSLQELDLSALYDDWQEQKIKVISMAMRIIHRSQTQIFKDLK